MEKEEIIKEIQDIYKFMNDTENTNYLPLKEEKGYDAEKWCDYYSELLLELDKRLRLLIENLTKHNNDFKATPKPPQDVWRACQTCWTKGQIQQDCPDCKGTGKAS